MGPGDLRWGPFDVADQGFGPSDELRPLRTGAARLTVANLPMRLGAMENSDKRQCQDAFPSAQW
jgi:hypothetical protein